jgi:hypothetical protein
MNEPTKPSAPPQGAAKPPAAPVKPAAPPTHAPPQPAPNAQPPGFRPSPPPPRVDPARAIDPAAAAHRDRSDKRRMDEALSRRDESIANIRRRNAMQRGEG